MREGEGNAQINEPVNVTEKNLNEHQEVQADNTLSKSGNVPRTRRNGSKKKAKPATTENDAKENGQQAETETLKEKPKKKKARKPKKKANHEDDKENVVPYEDGSESAHTSKSADTADPKHSETCNENAPKNSKKANGKKKKAPATREPLSEVANQELQQGEYSIDYQSLHDALRNPFTLDDKRGPIYFAPLTNKTKHHHEKAAPKFSYSTSAIGDASRNSNKSSPSAKKIYAPDRHAEIPPPAFMTTEKLGKKKKAAKTAKNEKSAIVKSKETKTNVSKKSTSATNNEEDASSTVLETKKPVEKTKSNDGKKDKSITTLGAPVKPVVFVKEEKKKTTIISAKKTSQVTQDERKRENKEIKKGMKHHDQEDYCHPNDIIHNAKTSRVRFDRYLNPKICQEKVEKGLLYKGVLRINKRSRSDAYVTCDNLDSDIFINGQHDRNRALDGDTVVVELLDLESVWAKKKESMVQKREQRHSTAAERPPQDEGQDDKGKPKYVGKVVAITATNKNQVCSGILSIHRNAPPPVKISTQGNEGDANTPEGNEEEDSNGTTSSSDNNKHIRLVWFKPTDTRKPMIAIQLKHAPADILKNEEKYKKLLMVAKITRWPIDSMNPFGTVLRELGHIGNIVAETQAVLQDNGIVEQPFGQKALKGLPETPWSISQSEIDKRRDLRDTRIFTIDPATAKDLDDAVHVIKLAEDEFEIGVHIADVSHFVHQHTALDHEAFDRGTSTYLCDRVIPMLPALLCEQLCSLNPGVERLAFSVIWKMDGAGNIKDTWFGKSVIKSCAKLAYEDAQNVIEDHGLPKTASVKSFSVSEVEQDIKYLFAISKQMRERRFSNGALSINSIRLSFKLNDLGEPCGVSIYEQKDANRLIEEFMLRANMSVAEKIAKHYPNEALLRQHSPPHERTLNEFIKIAENLGYSFDASTAGSMQKSFSAIESEDAKAVLRLLAVKPMQRAKYFCTGTCDVIKYRHYALNVPLYTHFTSPIRRFADIIVHRQLEAAINNKESCGYQKKSVTTAATHCNERKEGAKNSQDMNIQLYLAHYLHMLETQQKKPVICAAIVTQVLKDCFEILVPEYGLEKRVHMDALPIEKFVYDPHKTALAAYWKEGVESNREWDHNRKLDENYVEPSGTQLFYGTISDDEEENDHSVASKLAYKIPKELLSDNLVDETTKMQRFESFSKLTVRIQVNVERSPPIINIYPVNPFM
ncbi:RNB-domain-containing protein [Mucor ambiguus]|uniref:DIS3-like exonuclease 2 n=1 Tax=Mucor ambiguus TaxID=91626 RepID=A0A0C9LUH4_9FUNG|nr:RNB-domain-containing protein [Mucor ambiguus]